MKQVTAVEYLVNQFKIYLPSIHQEGLIQEFKKAKEMEKQQILDAVCQCDIRYNGITSSPQILKSLKQAENYYNETFKSE